MKISISNWNKEANGLLTLATSIVATFMAFADQVIALLHEAPFPVPESADVWIRWTLKMSTLILSIVTVFTKKTDSSGSDVTTNDAA